MKREKVRGRTMKIQQIGVIGAGTMGTDISVDLLLHGKKVVLVDVTEEKLQTATNEIIKILRFARLIDTDFTPFTADKVQTNLETTMDLNRLASCDFIIENIYEDVDRKKELYQSMEEILDPCIPIGANTSCISITLLGSFTRRPDTIIGMHWMNPVYKKRAVEVIQGYHTSPICLNQAQELLQSLGKKGIVVNDYPGFVSNRISHLFMNEAAFTVQDQVATPEQVDEIFTTCFGHQMGPLKTADLIGLDTVVASLQVLYDSYQDSKFRCCPLLKKMVHAGKLGVKTKEGFYKYT